MDNNRVDMYVMANAKYFHGHDIPELRTRMLELDDSRLLAIQSTSLKSPQTLLIVSILCGGLGIDRFMLGDIGLGIGKLLTCGGLGIWSIVDLFLIQKAAKEKNMDMIRRYLY